MRLNSLLLLPLLAGCIFGRTAVGVYQFLNPDTLLNSGPHTKTFFEEMKTKHRLTGNTSASDWAKIVDSEITYVSHSEEYGSKLYQWNSERTAATRRGDCVGKAALLYNCLKLQGSNEPEVVVAVGDIILALLGNEHLWHIWIRNTNEKGEEHLLNMPETTENWLKIRYFKKREPLIRLSLGECYPQGKNASPVLSCDLFDIGFRSRLRLFYTEGEKKNERNRNEILSSIWELGRLEANLGSFTVDLLHIGAGVAISRNDSKDFFYPELNFGIGTNFIITQSCEASLCADWLYSRFRLTEREKCPALFILSFGISIRF